MIPQRIQGATHCLGKPQSWDNERDGNCVSLWVRVEGQYFTSAWEPTPDELKALNEGKPVILTLYSAQVPVMLSVDAEK